MLKVRQITGILETCDDDTGDSEIEEELSHTTLRVQVRQSPYMDVFCGHNTIWITLDSGATGNMIKSSVARRVEAQVTSTNQSAHQADGSSPLNVTGETRLELSRDNKKFYLGALVVENLDVDLLAGTPFMEANDISLRPARRMVTLGDGTT